MRTLLLLALLACPWCGHKPKLYHQNRGWYSLWYAECPCAEFTTGPSKRAAIKNWNYFVRQTAEYKAACDSLGVR